MTIFFITNNYKPYSGGVVTALDSFAHELRAQGHTVLIITLDFLGKQEHDKNVIRLWCPIRFTYHHNYMAVPWQPTQKIDTLAQHYKPDIIHVFHPFLLGVSGLKVGKKLSIPVVFTYMTMYDRYLHYIPLPRGITKPIAKYLVKKFCSKVDLLIAPSESAKQHIHAQGIQNTISVLPLSILPLYLKPQFSVKPHSEKKFTLIFVSRFAKEKNIFFLLDVFAMLDQQRFKFILIGFGEEEEELKRYAYETLKLSHDAVTFIIKPSKEEMCAQYDAADLFVFASTSDTQGLVLAESMARGTPVVALKAPGAVDIIKDGKNGFLVQTQTDMKTVIEKIANDQHLFANLQRGAWETGNYYSPGACASKLLELYKGL